MDSHSFSEAIDSMHLEHARVLWNFHRMEIPLERSDFILALGSHDERVAYHAGRLFLDGWASLLVTSGGFGKVTRDSWKMSEGERFAEIALTMGVPASSILVESKAANTGDNILNTRALLQQRDIDVRRGILVTKPYMARRAFATASKQWPEVQWLVSAPPISFDEYPNDEVPLTRMINLMVGDLQRMKVYADQGFQVPTEIPPATWASYELLRDAGFDAFVIKPA